LLCPRAAGGVPNSLLADADFDFIKIHAVMVVQTVVVDIQPPTTTSQMRCPSEL
tara:strand:- start:12019 stop:12180 length:162 start_codon:yes stop_codon:yes gene_type:complete